MSHDVKIIRLEAYDFILASTEGPNAGTIVDTARLGVFGPSTCGIGA